MTSHSTPLAPRSVHSRSPGRSADADAPRRGEIPWPHPADVVVARDLTLHACRALEVESPRVENDWPTRTGGRPEKLFRFRLVKVFSIHRALTKRRDFPDSRPARSAVGRITPI